MFYTKENGASTATAPNPDNHASTTSAAQTADQPEQQPPISAMLARRLAGAASGYPDGRKIWFTARYQRRNLAFNVSEPYYDRPSAPGDREFGVFGPYQTPPEPTRRTEVVKVTLELSDGTKLTVDAEKVDTLFLSASAIGKFAIPYYGAVGDLELAMSIRNRFQESHVVALCHAPNTEWCLLQTTDSSSQQPSNFTVLVR